MVVAVTDKATVHSVSLEVIAEKGFHGASMREIARRVGTSLSNLYNYYSSKAALLCDVLDAGNEALLAAMMPANSTDAVADAYCDKLTASQPPVLEIVRSATEYSLSNPVIMRMALTEARYLEGEYREIVDEGQRKCISFLRSAITEHYSGLRLERFDSHYAARSIMLLTSHLPVWLRVDSDAEREALIQRHLGACARLVGIDGHTLPY